MNALLDKVSHSHEQSIAQCPMHKKADSKKRDLSPSDELILPMHKRVVVQYSTNEAGKKELHLFYGDKEISFDDPALFSFGVSLAKQPIFLAGTAVNWAENQDWADIKKLLETLVESGVLHYADNFEAENSSTTSKFKPSPLAPSKVSEAPTWKDCEAITKKLTGRALELGYLELVIPVFRIAHMSLDAEGRQVGESNVFPSPLRLDIATDWITCPHAGSRYMSDRPMNVTALKSMRAQWQQIMAALLEIRQAYLKRYPKAKERMTVGDVERLCALVLAVPTYMLMRNHEPVNNGELHPALSSMFRVTDGLRMTMHQMLFVPGVEANLQAEDVITSAETYAYAERNYTFHSPHGVCAGPQAMIEEFMRVVIDGIPARDTEGVVLDAEVREALDCIDAAFDYNLLGLQAHFVAFSLWPVMTRTYDQIWNVVEAWQGTKNNTYHALHEALVSKMHILKTATYHATEELRSARERTYAKLYTECALGLGELSAGNNLDEALTPTLKDEHVVLAQQLRNILQKNLGENRTNTVDDVEKIIVYLMNYFIRAQAILSLACEIQKRINTLLGRTQPSRPFYAADIDIHVIMQAEEARRLPQLLDAIEALLGMHVEITKDVISITEMDLTQTFH